MIGGGLQRVISSIPCERCKTLPNLTFDLAGTNFTITPWDYLLDLGSTRGSIIA
ncbi:hypothetical protein K469DRAFT_719955 [Zopfia rhizophila CBS 207.26]|uniref:Peptidase A1 domain-containing protein n=1 Tax=Zopfia rhizophila CBS 207.26 TaxID=1314779 RepID=A0A6A6EJ81_9PEZI|nr:hypothetical protein K469DRAFT_719955 [Zopfia rhizophila CBS 207.26]